MPPIPVYKNAPIAPNANRETSPPPPPTRTTPASAPATTTQTQDGSLNPPPPQPGARPVAPSTLGTKAPNVSSPAPPPPPQPGPTATWITTETRQMVSPPMQLTQPPSLPPPPSDSALAGRSTITSTATTATTASKSRPVTLDFDAAQGQPIPEHPPLGYDQAVGNSSDCFGGGIGVSAGQENQQEGIGAVAWNMLSKAGEALKKGEEAAWKAVRNK